MITTQRLICLSLVCTTTAISLAEVPALSGGQFNLFVDVDLTVPGLIGSYVNQNLREHAEQDDWRNTQTISGTRLDLDLEFTELSWGTRSEVGLTGGSDDNWESFSVQWDGFVEIITPGTRLATVSDDSSRMWIDINHNGVFEPGPSELVNNHWGTPQATTRGELSPPLSPDVYAVRIQYEESSGGNVLRLVSPPTPALRVGYVIPADRIPQATAEENLQSLVLLFRATICEQMDRNGFGPRSFRYEAEADCLTPRIHLINVAESAAYVRGDVPGDIWGRTITAAANSGVPVWSTGEVWLLFPEVHEQQPDGTIDGGVALGSGGSGDGAGVAMVGSERISLFKLDDLVDDTVYAGVVVSEIGPFPLSFDNPKTNEFDGSFPSFEGPTFSSVLSSIQGAVRHETLHAFGIAHDARNDTNFHGNIMRDGLRGLRGTIFPNFYPEDDSRLSYAAALALSLSPYFTDCDLHGMPSLASLHQSAPDRQQVAHSDPVTVRTVSRGHDRGTADYNAEPTQTPGELIEGGRSYLVGHPDLAGGSEGRELTPLAIATSATDFGPVIANGSDGPIVAVSTSGVVDPVGGHLRVEFQAEDDSGLAVALLRRNGATIGEMVLSGASVSTFFDTPYYDPTQADTFGIGVYDQDGNRTEVETSITPNVPANRAPQPFVSVRPSRAYVGQKIELHASRSWDPDGSSFDLSVEWDLDGDGSFDTPQSHDKTLTTNYGQVGSRLIRVRVTDPGGAQSVSTPIAIRTVPSEAADITVDGHIGLLDFFALKNCMGGPGRALATKCASTDLDTDGDNDLEDFAQLSRKFSGAGTSTPCP